MQDGDDDEQETRGNTPLCAKFRCHKFGAPLQAEPRRPSPGQSPFPRAPNQLRQAPAVYVTVYPSHPPSHANNPAGQRRRVNTPVSTLRTPHTIPKCPRMDKTIRRCCVPQPEMLPLTTFLTRIWAPVVVDEWFSFLRVAFLVNLTV